MGGSSTLEMNKAALAAIGSCVLACSMIVVASQGDFQRTITQILLPGGGHDWEHKMTVAYVKTGIDNHLAESGSTKKTSSHPKGSAYANPGDVPGDSQSEMI